MNRLVAAAGAALALLGNARADAAGFHFEAVSTPATAICAAPCYQIRMFVEDATRSYLLQGLQFDLSIFGGAILATLPSQPPWENGNVSEGNAFLEDLDGEVRAVPWDLASTVADPGGPRDVRVLVASTQVLSVAAVQARRDAAASCAPSPTCVIQLDALIQDRLYLGRFNVTWSGGPVGLQVELIDVVAPDDGSFESLEGVQLGIEGFPEFEPVDSDGDGLIDGNDNCPAVANLEQRNRDRDDLGDVCDLCPDFGTTENGDVDGNGIGDACECGDQTGDGVVDTRDLIAINLAIFRGVSPSPLCDTNDDGLCNVKDIVGAHAKTFGRPAYCRRYPAPPPPRPRPSGANLVRVDLESAGDGWITHDLDTGLQWLDPGVTVGASIDQIVAGYPDPDHTWFSNGWRQATEAEVCDLVVRATGQVSGCVFPYYSPAIEDIASLQGFLGTTSATGTHTLARYATGYVLMGPSASTVNGILTVVRRAFEPSFADPQMGHLLVRTAP